VEKKRLYYLDHLRVILTVLVLLHHTAITYGADGSWVYEDVEPTNGLSITAIILTLFTAINQSFFMGLFFFLSGYFTLPSYERKGAGVFLKDRLIRLGIPLIFYTFLIGPFIQYIVGFKNRYSFGIYYRKEILTFQSINIGPLWFIEALLIFSILYIMYRKFFSSCHNTKRSFPSNKSLFYTAVGLGVSAFFIRLFWPTGEGVLGLQFGYFASYIVLFIAGTIAYHQNWLDQLRLKTVKRWGWISVITIPILPIALIATGALEGTMNVSGGWSFQAFVYAMWEPFVCIGICLWLLSMFKTRHNVTKKMWRTLSGSAYTLYIIHPLVLVSISLYLHQFDIPDLLKFLIVAVTGPVSGFVLSAWICKIPGIKRIL
jgi:glucans biosynthesis protein C